MTTKTKNFLWTMLVTDCVKFIFIKILVIEKRRIYDLINIFSSFELIKRVGKGSFVWKGLESMESKIK